MSNRVKIALVLLLLAFIGSCKTYNNFRAYYNTYYNAKKSFRAGLEKIDDRPAKLNPGEFITVFPSPPAAGSRSFKKAIDIAFQILRRFPETKWADNALLLIGKSYYYRQQYYRALQKFESLLDFKKSDLKLTAAIGKSRALFETGAYRQGMNFMNDFLTRQQKTKSVQTAKAKIILSQLTAGAGILQAAADTLLSAIPVIKNNDLKGRAYFFLGQIYMQLESFIKAYQSFSNVESFSPAYEVIYYANLKSAQAAAAAGRLNLAVRIFKEMLRDDKNYQRRAEISYHFGRIAEKKGSFITAKKLYKKVLSSPKNRYSAHLLSAVYYRMAHLYSYNFKNYRLAAAYFDSSRIVGDELAPNARALGRYVSLKVQISRIDSLLRLASLSPSSLDSVLRLYRSKIQQRQALTHFDDNSLQNIVDKNGNRYEKAYATAFGFLNYKNSALAARGKQQFKAVWGERPLVDNWRRIEAVAAANIINSNKTAGKSKSAKVEKKQVVKGSLNNLLANIPFAEKEQKALRKRKKILQYRLANVFFLALNQPDSAAFYFQKIIPAEKQSALASKALYSLYKLYHIEENFKKAAYYKNIILRRFPGGVYAARLGRQRTSPDTGRLHAAFSDIQTDTSLTLRKRAEKLEHLALSNQNSELAARIYYQSIRSFIKIAKVKAQPLETFTYTGPYWEKVRAMLAKFNAVFPNAPFAKQVITWQEMLQKDN